MPSALVIDAKALYDTYHKETTVLGTACKRTAIELLVLKQTLRETGSVMRWVSSERQVADGLTKSAARQLFADRLRTQQYRLVFDESFTAAKKKTAEDRHKNENEGTKRQRKIKHPEPPEHVFLLSVLAQPFSQASPLSLFCADDMPKKDTDFTADWSDDDEEQELEERSGAVACETRRSEQKDEGERRVDEDDDRRNNDDDDEDENKNEDEPEPQGKGKGKTRTRAGRRGGRSVREWRERHQQQLQRERQQRTQQPQQQQQQQQ